MRDFFYFIGILFLIYELYYLMNIRSFVEGTYKFIELQKVNKGRSWESSDEEYKNLLIGRGCPALVFFLWMHIGLCTNNWVFFLGFLIIQYLVMQPLNKLTKYTPIYLFLQFLNTLLGVGFTLFIILNAYHLNIDITPQVIEFIDNLFK